MNGKICLITGASDGIGKATALGLARLGAHVVMVSRQQEKGQAALAEVRAASGSPNVELMLADLSSQAEIQRLAAQFIQRYGRLHVLINNAGIALTRRNVTVDGVEKVFAVNYLAPFLLTNLLLPVLCTSAPARVINVAGDFHRKAVLDFDDLMCERSYNGFKANNQAKLAMILFTYELARRLQGTGVTANCLHPGPVATGVLSGDPDLRAFDRLMYSLVKPFFQTPEQGAATSIYLASSPDAAGVSGKYFIKKKAVTSSPASYDTGTAQRLWEISARLTALDSAGQLAFAAERVQQEA